MKKLYLSNRDETKDKCFTLVDDVDFFDLNKFSWCIQPSGRTSYAIRSEILLDGKRRTIRLHRVILGAKKGEKCDHKNGDGLDNRRKNLRICSQIENGQNRRISKNNSLGFKGVVFDRRMKERKFRAKIKVNRKLICLGYYKTPQQAAKAYNRAANEFFGDFARLNTFT